MPVDFPKDDTHWREGQAARVARHLARCSDTERIEPRHRRVASASSESALPFRYGYVFYGSIWCPAWRGLQCLSRGTSMPARPATPVGGRDLAATRTFDSLSDSMPLAEEGRNGEVLS
jgi:hypothetical protein